MNVVKYLNFPQTLIYNIQVDFNTMRMALEEEEEEERRWNMTDRLLPGFVWVRQGLIIFKFTAFTSRKLV